MADWKITRNTPFESNWLAEPLPRTPITIDDIDIGDFSGDDQLRLRSDLTYHRCHLPEGYAPPEFDDDNGSGDGDGDDDRVLNPPDVYIEMLNIALWQPSPLDYQSTPAEFYRTLDTDDFDGSPTFWWEVVGYNSNAQYGTGADYSIQLVDLRGNVYASITLPSAYPDATGQNLGRQRVQFTPPEGETTFAVRFNPYTWTGDEPVGEGCDPTLGAVRIIVKQTNPTKSMIQVPMHCLGDWGSDTNYLDEPIDFYTWGRYTAKAYANPAAVTDDFDWCCYAGVWRYEESELATVSRVLLEAVAGSPPALVAGDNTSGFYVWLDEGDAAPYWSVALFDALGNMVPGSQFEGGGSEPISELVNLQLEQGTYYPKISIDGVNWSAYATSWTIDHYPYGGTVGWSAVGGPWFEDQYGGGSGLHFQVRWSYQTASSPDTISIALFDRTANEMVPGSEITWEADTLVSRKAVEIDASELTSGHEYELRYMVASYGGTGAVFGYENNLYLYLDPISAITVWQRVGKSEYLDYFGRYEAPHVGDEARTLLRIPDSATVYFENCAWSWGIEGDEISEFPRLYRLFDVGETDFGIEGSAIAPSSLQWEVGDPTEVVTIKRSEALTLTDGNRFIVDQPNYEYDLFQVQAFIVIKSVKE
jgi:hypothetical protein